MHNIYASIQSLIRKWLKFICTPHHITVLFGEYYICFQFTITYHCWKSTARQMEIILLWRPDLIQLLKREQKIIDSNKTIKVS